MVGDSISKELFLDHMSVRKLEESVIDIVFKNHKVLIENQSVFGQTLKRTVDKKIFLELHERFDKIKDNIVVEKTEKNISILNC